MPHPKRASSSVPRRSLSLRVLLSALAGVVVGSVLYRSLFEDAGAGEEETKATAAVVRQASNKQADLTESQNENVMPADDPEALVVTLGSWVVRALPNTRGEYPRQSVPAGADVEAILRFPDAAAGDLILVQADDGGRLDGVDSGTIPLDQDLRVRLAFTTAAYEGLQRITLWHGGESRRIEFWVGPAQPVLVRR